MAKKRVKVGDRVKVVNNTSGHNYQMGKVYEVVSSVNGTIQCKDSSGWHGNSMYSADYVIAVETKEQIQKTIDELEKNIQEEKSKLAWMNETGAEVYDETEHKVWSVLSTVESESLSKIEKVKLIASLIN